jgi:hypothetical protein
MREERWATRTRRNTVLTVPAFKTALGARVNFKISIITDILEGNNLLSV